MRINFDAFGPCLDKIAQRGKIQPDEARQILQEVADRAEQMRRTGLVDPFVKAAGELAQRVSDTAKLNKIDALRNAQLRAAALERIDANGGAANAAETLRADMHGTYKTSLDSVQAHTRGMASEWQGALAFKVRQAGAEKAVISGAMDEDIAKDIWKNNGGAGNGSGNVAAKAVADAIQPIMKEIKDRLNAAGARIGTAIDYVSHTRHDPVKMRRAAGSMAATPDDAFAAWWEKTRPKLSEATFEGITPREGETTLAAQNRFGRSVFKALVSGVHMTPAGVSGITEGYVPPTFEGTRNVARKLSQPRVLKFKDPESWNSYMQEFGRQTSLTQGIMQSIHQGARQIALMEKFGTNPAANLNQIIRAVEEKYRPDLDATGNFQGKVNGLRNVMSYLDGSSNIPANEFWAKVGQNTRQLYDVFDLGGVGVTHFASIWPTVSSEMRHHGIGRLEAVGTMIRSLLQGKGSVERQEILSDLGAYGDGLSRDMNSSYQPDTPIPGRLSSMANTFMKYTGLHYVFDNTQAAVRSMLSHNLARNMTNDFGSLEPHLQQMLGQYRVTPRDWDTMRSATNLRTENGRAYLTPRDLDVVDPSGVLSDKLNGYLSDTAAHAVVTAGARERAMLLGGSRPGSGWGEAARFVSQFKMWPVAAYDQLLRREIHMSTSRTDAAWGLGSMIALSTAAGYMRMAINDAALGNPVRSPMDPKTLLAGLAQGGGMGILGDFLFGEVLRNRTGAGVMGTLAGPLVSDVDAFLGIYNDWLHGKAGWPDLARFAGRHIPFANLVYLKGVLDYAVLYHLYEAASPGWWERSNRRLQKEQGRTMSGYVPGQGVPWIP